MTDAKHNRKRTTGMHLVSVLVLGLSLPACSLKWGDDARRAAAEHEAKQRLERQKVEQAQFEKMNKPVSEPVSEPVSDPVSDQASGKADPVQNKKTASKTSASSAKVQAKVRYIRIGKERRLAMVVNDDAATENNIASTSEAAQTPVSTPKVSDFEHRLSNTKSHASFKHVNPKPAPVSTASIRYPGTQMYGAGLDDSVWLVNSSKLSCELVHPVPRYGRVVFRQRAGHKLQFQVYLNRSQARILTAQDKRYANPLYTDKYPYPHVGARLESVPPIWKRQIYQKNLGFMPLTPGKIPFTLPHHKKIPAQLAQAEMTTTGKNHKVKMPIPVTETYLPEIWPERLLTELEDGMSLRFTYRDWADGTEDVVVNISAINFMDVVGGFETCTQKLKQFKFSDYRTTTINYSKNAKGLSKRAKIALNKIADYLNTKPDVKSINITAYTDSRGFKRLNRELSAKFANMVKQYLQKKGVDVAITTKGAGEGKYLDSNRTAQGRAKNQRIIVSLKR